jgi:hypothetical protein
MHSLSADLGGALKQLTGMRHSVGIYSLSRTPTDELMWAHYAESHAGFCIEYDLERLMLEARTQWTRLDVVYSEEPPTLAIEDLIRAPNPEVATAKLVGCKSKRWSYEDEVRLITASAGVNHYARPAVTGIFFGCRCSDETIERVRIALAGRAHTYARVVYPERSYRLRIDDLPRAAIDGTMTEHRAPVEDGAIAAVDDLGEHGHLHPLLLRAVDQVTRDPSCKKGVWADVSPSGPRRGQIFVVYETSVETALDNKVKQYFDPEVLAVQPRTS